MLDGKDRGIERNNSENQLWYNGIGLSEKSVEFAHCPPTLFVYHPTGQRLK